MDAYSAIKDEILRVNQDVLQLFTSAKSRPGMAEYSFGEWEKTCANLPDQLAEDTIRVAIAGPIKSGKSTFLNSFFKGEYVKRGAGVITSIVTRVRNGKRLRAKLFLKSWEEINTEMEQSLVLFPSTNWRSENGKFDIRKEHERLDLQQALSRLGADKLITQSTRNINNVLLSSYLKGYQTVESLISRENNTQMYEDDHFSDHKAFVGNESLAVYLKDVLLEINSNVVRSNIEIADCQGSDSSNPMHLAMIQDYLLLTHLIIYVISSRTGLRQADIRFLSIIKKMGILDNIAFIINCDFSEHDSFADLESLIDQIREELSMIKPDPDIYSFSTLFNLFSSQEENLSAKDRLRLQQWQADGELTELSDQESNRFESDFYDRLARKRFALLMKNHIERLGVILTGINEWIGFSRNVLTKDAKSAAEILRKIKIHQKRFNKIQSAIEKTLTGTIPEINKELQTEVHQYFDAHSGVIAKDIGNHIRAFNFSSEHTKGNIKAAEFSETLYLVFQEFKQYVDSYITEVVNPEVIRFVQLREKHIREHFEALMIPFDTMLEDASEEINTMLGLKAMEAVKKKHVRKQSTNKDERNKSDDNVPPKLMAAMQYSAKIRTEAIVRLGFYRVSRNLKILFRKPAKRKGGHTAKALQDAVRRMKQETEKSIMFHIKDYRENLKFGYLFKLVEATSEDVAQAVLSRFQAYFSDLSTTVARLGARQNNKGQAMQVLDEMDKVVQELNFKIKRVREEVG